MAKLKHGLNGVITGRVGNLVYYELDGVQVVRRIGARPAKYTKAQWRQKDGAGSNTGHLSILSGRGGRDLYDLYSR